MNRILEEKIKEATGMTIHNNMFTMSSHVKKNGEVVFQGDYISCNIYIARAYDKLTKHSKQ